MAFIHKCVFDDDFLSYIEEALEMSAFAVVVVVEVVLAAANLALLALISPSPYRLLLSLMNPH